MKSFFTLLKIETLLMIRGVNTLFFGVGFPIVVALCMGLLISDTAYYESTFAAISTIGICATGLMGFPLTVSEYRHHHILKRYALTPLTPGRLLFIQILINAGVAFLSLVCVYAIMTIYFGFQFHGNLFVFLLVYLLIMAAVFGIGMVVASIAADMKMANLLCTVLYFPMILLSGTILPYDSMPAFIQKIMKFSPLTQGIDLLNNSMQQGPIDWQLPFLILSVIAILSTVISIKCFRWSDERRPSLWN